MTLFESFTALLAFLALVVLDSFGLLAFRLADETRLLLQIGLGGYVAGRSAEKITGQVIGARMKKTARPKAGSYPHDLRHDPKRQVKSACGKI